MKTVLTFLLFCIPFFIDAKTKLPFADKVLVKKSERKIFLLKNGKAYREYSIALGDEPKGHKQKQGDEKTTEGLYTIDYRNPKSAYHLSLHINYHNEKDKASAQHDDIDLGGDIFIHGSPNGFNLSKPAYCKV